MRKYTYEQWLKEWVKIYKKPYIKSVRNIQINIRLHIPQHLKDTLLTNIMALDVQKSINSIKSSRIAIDVYDIYNASLKMAYNLDLINRDITKTLVKPKHTRKQGQALSSSELQEFLKAIKGKRIEKYFLFCLYTGCRRSEALNVRWQDIDYTFNVLHIKGTKTTTSDRYIPLFDDLMELLNTLPKGQGKIFNHHTDYVSKTFKKYCPTHKLHDLRHTFATRCLECGINLKVVQQWLGHSNYNTTANIYSHALQEFTTEESKKLKF